VRCSHFNFSYILSYFIFFYLTPFYLSIMAEPDYLLIRRKQMNSEGEWEYECSVCKNWLPKLKFRGCKTYVDAYGNCLMCSSCRSKLARQKGEDNTREEVDKILTKLGFYEFPNQEAYMEHIMKKYSKK